MGKTQVWVTHGAVVAPNWGTGVSVGMIDPAQAAQIETGAGAGDGDVGEACFAVVDRAGHGAAVQILLVGVLGWGEVVGDSHLRPFTPLARWGSGDGDLGVRFGGELVDRGEDGLGAVLVDEVDERPEALVAFIGNQRTGHGIPHTVTCRAPGVSEAWFHKWRRRPTEPTKREVRRTRLEERITRFFRSSGETYGSPRITLDLWAEGWQVSVNTVAEIMADLGLQGREPPRKRRSLTRQGKRRASPDLVHRKFDAVAPDVLWVGDMTEIETGEGSCTYKLRGITLTDGPAVWGSTPALVSR
jgi:hypothetical protein